MSSDTAVNTSADSIAARQSRRTFGFDFPYLVEEWKEMLKVSTVGADIWAGITVALVALPLNLALAIAAGVEPGVGITTGVVAGIVGSLFGGQRYAVTGPAAAMAVILIQIAQTYGIGGVWMVGLIAGLLQLVAGYFRLGKLISFIPSPVIVGFSNAIGILVVFNALDDFLGVSKKVAHATDPSPESIHPLIPEFVQDINDLAIRVIQHHEARWEAAAIGLAVLAVAVLVPRLTKMIPGQLVAITVGSIAAAVLAFDIPRIETIAHIPRTIPMPFLPNFPWGDLDVLFPSALTVFMLGSIESLLSASVADGMTMSRRHHSDQELMGQGLANLVTPFFGGIPVTGVIARTAVNIRSGAKTRLSGIVHSLFLLFLSYVFAPYAEKIPLAALAGILVLTGFRLIEFDAFKQIWRASRTEGWVVLLTTVVSVLIDLTAGVMTGLIITCLLFVRQMSAMTIRPQDDSTDRRDSLRPPYPACKFVRTFLLDGPLFFGAAERFTETILFTQNLKAVILHMRAVHVMDLTGLETLLSIHAQLKRNGVRLVLAELALQPLEILRRTDAIETIGLENFFNDYEDALLDVNLKVLSTSCRACAGPLFPEDKKLGSGPKDCPLRNALAVNSNNVTTKLKLLLNEQQQITPVPPDLKNTTTVVSRLVPIFKQENIPAFLHGTPIEELIRCQNFGEVEQVSQSTPNLIIGMCMDYRKQLVLPKNCAYVLREAGANMMDSEFSIGLAVSTGIKNMALITHNNCVMSRPHERREAFIRSLIEEHGWDGEQACDFFDSHASSREINDAIDFAIREADRIHLMFRSLNVVPMVYIVDDDRLYLIREWVAEQYARLPAPANGD